MNRSQRKKLQTITETAGQQPPPIRHNEGMGKTKKGTVLNEVFRAKTEGNARGVET